jgi:hypothetical protein
MIFETTYLRKDRIPAHNKVLPKAGLNGFDWRFVQSSTSDFRLDFSAKNPQKNDCAKNNNTFGCGIVF